MKRLLAVSVLINAAFIGRMAFRRLTPSSDEKSVRAVWNHRSSQFAQLAHSRWAQDRPVVFLGDSLTAGIEWAESFPDLPVVNRGIGGDTTEGVLRRINQIVAMRPRAVFLMIGTNELPGAENTAANAREIMRQLKESSPETRVFVQSILPRGEAFKNPIIERVNGLLRKHAAEFGYEFIDLYPLFLENGALAARFSDDGVHVNGVAYSLWVERLRPYVGAPDVQP